MCESRLGGHFQRGGTVCGGWRLFRRLETGLTRAGLIVRGGFHPNATDNVPLLPDGKSVGTVVLIGNAGSALWRAFQDSAPDLCQKNPLNDWLRPKIVAAATAVGAHVLYPHDGPPFPPFQDWGARAEPLYRSPMGIMIHPEFGLWHAYRAAFCFAGKLELPPRETRSNPCDACHKKPCQTVCPVEAFKPDRFEADDCAHHVESAAGETCRNRGCMSRRACPVGREYAYPQAAQHFHGAHFLHAVKSGFGRSSTDATIGDQ